MRTAYGHYKHSIHVWLTDSINHSLFKFEAMTIQHHILAINSMFLKCNTIVCLVIGVYFGVYFIITSRIINDSMDSIHWIATQMELSTCLLWIKTLNALNRIIYNLFLICIATENTFGRLRKQNNAELPILTVLWCKVDMSTQVVEHWDKSPRDLIWG